MRATTQSDFESRKIGVQSRGLAVIVPTKEWSLKTAHAGERAPYLDGRVCGLCPKCLRGVGPEIVRQFKRQDGQYAA
nr:MAG TPA: Queuosine biosynthesis protein QueC [Caudoviricetes sp.]